MHSLSSVCAFCTVAPLGGGAGSYLPHCGRSLRRPRGSRASPRRVATSRVRMCSAANGNASGDDRTRDENEDDRPRNDGDGEQPVENVRDGLESVSGDSASTDGDGVVIDMNMLRRRMEEVKQEERASDETEEVVELSFAYDMNVEAADDFEVDDDSLRLLNEQFDNLDVLYVILFGSSSSKEGVYSLALNGVNIVLAFQERSEARRYALMLEAQSFPNSKVGEFTASELKTFCGKSGHRLGLVPKGSLLTPPDDTVSDSLDDWVVTDANQSNAANETGMDSEEIELMKTRLENLFGSDTGSNDDTTEGDGGTA